MFVSGLAAEWVSIDVAMTATKNDRGIRMSLSFLVILGQTVLEIHELLTL